MKCIEIRNTDAMGIGHVLFHYRCKPTGVSKWHCPNNGGKLNRVEFKTFLLLKTVRVCNTILTSLITLKVQLFEGSFNSFSGRSAAKVLSIQSIYLLNSNEFVIRPFERIKSYHNPAAG